MASNYDASTEEDKAGKERVQSQHGLQSEVSTKTLAIQALKVMKIMKLYTYNM